jgi:hypothetical protein
MHGWRVGTDSIADILEQTPNTRKRAGVLRVRVNREDQTTGPVQKG